MKIPMMQHYGHDPFILKEKSEMSVDKLSNMVYTHFQNFLNTILIDHSGCLTMGYLKIELFDKWTVWQVGCLTSGLSDK